MGIEAGPQQPSNNTNSSSNNWNKEKDGLIFQIDNLKGELQRVVASLSLEKEKSNGAIAAKDILTKQKEELQMMRAQLQTEIDEMKQQNSNTVADLTRENKVLTAQLKQLQCGVSQQHSVEHDKQKSSNDAHAVADENVYDIEAITDHKGGKNNRQYRVRWQGYGSDDDTWEKESSVECVLCKYKKAKNII